MCIKMMYYNEWLPTTWITLDLQHWTKWPWSSSWHCGCEQKKLKNSKTWKLASIHCTGTTVMIVVVVIITVLCCRCKQKKRSKLLTCWVDPDTLDWRSWGCWWLSVLSSSLRCCAAVVNKKKKKKKKKNNTYLLGWPRYAGSAELGVLVAISVDLRRC